MDGTKVLMVDSNAGVGIGGSSYVGGNPPAGGMIIEGNVGIGTTSPGGRLSVRQNFSGFADFTAHIGGGGAYGFTEMIGSSTDDGDTPYLSFHRGGAIAYQFGLLGNDLTIAAGGGASTSNLFATKVLTIQGGGNVGIGTTTPSQRLHVIGNVRVEGNIFATGTISVPPSDARLKTALEPLTGALEKLDQVQAVSFEWNALGQSLGQPGGRRELGVLAQELERVYPELVTRSGPEEYRAVDYSRLTVVLLEAIKEQQHQIKAQQEELAGQREQLQTQQRELEMQREQLEALQARLPEDP